MLNHDGKLFLYFLGVLFSLFFLLVQFILMFVSPGLKKKTLAYFRTGFLVSLTNKKKSILFLNFKSKREM